jgi:hypothetical protein
MRLSVRQLRQLIREGEIPGGHLDFPEDTPGVVKRFFSKFLSILELDPAQFRVAPGSTIDDGTYYFLLTRRTKTPVLTCLVDPVSEEIPQWLDGWPAGYATLINTRVPVQALIDADDLDDLGIQGAEIFKTTMWLASAGYIDI